MKIGILGGSFDPVHLGHERLAKSAIYELQLDKLIIIPANIQPFKQDFKPSSPETRLRMLELAFSDYENVEISSFEIDLKGVSYTYNTLNAFKELYPSDDIYFIMGGDSVIKLDKWFKAESLLKEFKFGVSLRPGTDNSDIYKKIDEYQLKYGAKLLKITEPMLDISSTEIREKIKTQDYESLKELLNMRVIEYIKENNLYV